MSARAEEWARSVKGRTIAQRDVLLAMARVADDSGAVGPLTALQGDIGGMTPQQVVKTAETLLRLGFVTKGFDMGIYQWVWHLRIKP